MGGGRRHPGAIPVARLSALRTGWNAHCPRSWMPNPVAACDGDDLVHLDVRSDNLCFAGGRTLLVDWNLAGSATGWLMSLLLPSLAFEGGPLPEDACPDANTFAARVAGFFAARAGEPDIPDAPFVRRVQREQLSTAFPWAVRVLGLPLPDGVPLGNPRV